MIKRLKSKKGAAIEMAICFGVIVFMLCLMITTAIIIKFKESRLYEQQVPEKVKIDQLGDYFISYVKANDFSAPYQVWVKDRFKNSVGDEYAQSVDNSYYFIFNMYSSMNSELFHNNTGSMDAIKNTIKGIQNTKNFYELQIYSKDSSGNKGDLLLNIGVEEDFSKGLETVYSTENVGETTYADAWRTKYYDTSWKNDRGIITNLLNRSNSRFKNFTLDALDSWIVVDEKICGALRVNVSDVIGDKVYTCGKITVRNWSEQSNSAFIKKYFGDNDESKYQLYTSEMAEGTDDEQEQLNSYFLMMFERMRTIQLLNGRIFDKLEEEAFKRIGNLIDIIF